MSEPGVCNINANMHHYQDPSLAASASACNAVSTGNSLIANNPIVDYEDTTCITKTNPTNNSSSSGLPGTASNNRRQNTGAGRGRKALAGTLSQKYNKKTSQLKFNSSSQLLNNPFHQSENSNAAAAAAAAAAYLIAANSSTSSSSSSISSSSSKSSKSSRLGGSGGGGGNGGGSSKRKRKRVLNRMQRAEATMREKRRMLKLNRAFEDLRKVLPSQQYAPKNKLSRAETLKGAIEHIDYLSKLLSIN